MTHAALLTEPDSAPWPRGVLASYENVTPQRRSDDITTRKLSLRDAVFIALGVAGMWGVQVATQYGIRSDVRDLKTSFDAYVQQQSSTNISMQQQINEWRSETKLNRERSVEQDKALSELRGFLVGSGIIKGTSK